MNNNINLSQYIDHTLLKADSTITDIELLCNQAIEFKFYGVCVNSCHTKRAKEFLTNTPVNIATTVGFPLGAMHSSVKVAEALQAVQDGADEVDMVLNIGFLKSRMNIELLEDMKTVKQAVGNTIVKIIFENCLLTLEEKLLACKIAIDAGVDFIKTSTGFNTGTFSASGATRADLVLMLKAVANTGIKVKAAGGVKDYYTAMDYISMGVARIGTSSGISLVSEMDVDNANY